MSTSLPQTIQPRPLSSFRVLGDTIYVSGQVGVQEGKILDGFDAQMTQTLENLKNVLQEAGTSVQNVVKCTCFVRNEADADAFNRMYSEFFAPGLLSSMQS